MLEKETDDKILFIGLSVSDMIRTCLLNGMSKCAEKARSDFNAPDKWYVYSLPPDVSSNHVACLPHIHSHFYIRRFWYLKLCALTDMRDSDGLSEFARSKCSPIGFEVFVRYLVLKSHTRKATAFVPQRDTPRCADLYVKCGDWKAATREAKERGDKAKLECVSRLLSSAIRSCVNPQYYLVH